MSKTKESLNEWTSSLMQEIPQMLVKLLDQKNGESIERLQLVDVEISLGKKNQGETISQLKRYSSANNNFIHVCSFIYDHSLDIRIAYFVRGQKKFYQPTAQMSQQFLWEAWMSIDRAWVHNALKDAGQENSALSSLELAQLYGRKDIQIPSQLVLFLLIKEALEE